MAELKLTPQAIRKIITNGNLPKSGAKKVPVLDNRICVGYVSSPTGMDVRTFIKGKYIQVWAHTKTPVDDIKVAAELLENAGYKAEVNGFQCLVSLN